jgi:hypothetical protein
MPLLLYYGTNQATATSREGLTVVSKLQNLMSRNVWNVIMFDITDKDDYFCFAYNRNK